jgi:hypothetical protein
MSNEPKDQDLDIEEGVDGSAVVDLPDDFVTDDDNSNEPVEKNEGGNVQDEEPDHPDDSEAVLAAKRARRKAKRDLAKRGREEKDAQIQALRRQNEEMQRKLAQADQRLQRVEQESHQGFVSRVEKAVQDQQVRVEYAKMKLAEAANSGDGQAMVEAQEMMYQARKDLDALENQRRQIDQHPRQQPVAPAAPDPRVQRNAADWLKRNNWYKVDGSDTDSRIAKEVDVELSKEGWTPTDPDYWDELDNRLQKYLPHRYNGASDGNSAVRKPRNVVGSSGREASAAYGGTNRNQFTLSPERVKAMKEIGAWDNPERKKKMIAEFIRYDRQGGNR